MKIKTWMLAAIRPLVIIMVFCSACVFTSCLSNDIDPVTPSEEEEYTGMLHYYQQQGRCKLLGVVVDREGEDCAACTDVMNTYFGRSDVPIGLVRDGIKNPTVWIDYKALPTYTKDDNTSMFSRSIDDYSALPDGWQLYRRLLAAQPDHSVSICSVGFAVCLAQLLESVGDAYSPLSGVELATTPGALPCWR